MTTDDLRAWASAHAPEMPQAVKVLELLAWCDPMYSRGWCQHCGWTGDRKPRAEAAADVAAHTLACDRHPMRAVEDERDALREALTPFADWYTRYGPGELDPVAVPAYRHAAELLQLLKGGG